MILNVLLMGMEQGFFCKIPFPDPFHLLPVLITNNHVIGEKENDLVEGTKINISLIKNSINREILFDNSRKIYTNKNYDVTNIELRLDDNFTEEQFLEINENINVDDFNEEYKDKVIYLIGNNFNFGNIYSISIENMKLNINSQHNQVCQGVLY